MAFIPFSGKPGSRKGNPRRIGVKHFFRPFRKIRKGLIPVLYQRAYSAAGNREVCSSSSSGWSRRSRYFCLYSRTKDLYASASCPFMFSS